MKRFWLAPALALAIFPLGEVRACEHDQELDPAHVKLASVVVIGRIENYHIVRDEEARIKDPSRGTSSYLEDYARFDIVVDEVLRGLAPRRLSVTWEALTMAEPSALVGKYLVALQSPPQFGPYGPHILRLDRTLPTVLNNGCAGGFIVPMNSRDARSIRKLLSD